MFVHHAATGGKAVRDGPAQQVFVLFKKSVHTDLIHAEEDVVLDHIFKPVGQQASKANGYFLSGLGPGIYVQGMSFKVSAVAQDSVVVQTIKRANQRTHRDSSSSMSCSWTSLGRSFHKMSYVKSRISG